jgi:hypothetical protein
MKKVYLISSDEKSSLVRASLFAREVTDIHRSNRLDALFLSPESNYELLRDYCSSNKTGTILLRDIRSREEVGCFQEIYGYLMQSLDAPIAYISEQCNESMINSLFESKFDFESISI